MHLEGFQAPRKIILAYFDAMCKHFVAGFIQEDEKFLKIRAVVVIELHGLASPLIERRRKCRVKQQGRYSEKKPNSSGQDTFSRAT